MMVETMATADGLRPTAYRKDGNEMRIALDRFFRVEEGRARPSSMVFIQRSAAFAVLIPAGTNHDIVHTGSVPVKLCTLYAPPNLRDGVAHHARIEGENDTEHFGGKTAE